MSASRSPLPELGVEALPVEPGATVGALLKVPLGSLAIQIFGRPGQRLCSCSVKSFSAWKAAKSTVPVVAFKAVDAAVGASSAVSAGWSPTGLTEESDLSPI